MVFGRVNFSFPQEEEGFGEKPEKNPVFLFLKTEFYFIHGKERALKKNNFTEKHPTSRKKNPEPQNISTEIILKQENFSAGEKNSAEVPRVPSDSSQSTGSTK